jgi:hypothetical protein
MNSNDKVNTLITICVIVFVTGLFTAVAWSEYLNSRIELAKIFEGCK